MAAHYMQFLGLQVENIAHTSDVPTTGQNVPSEFLGIFEGELDALKCRLQVRIKTAVQ